MENCIFCKIANGEIPSNTLYEDERFRVILDISPASKGHAILLPKNHAKNLFELSTEDAKYVLPVVQKVAAAMQRALKCDGVNILQNNGEAAGQTVFHYHMHIIPRYEGDQVQIGWKPGTEQDVISAEMIQQIQKEM